MLNDGADADVVQRARRRRTGRAAASRRPGRTCASGSRPPRVGRAGVLDLEHQPLAGLVRRCRPAWRSARRARRPRRSRTSAGRSPRSSVVGVTCTGGSTVGERLLQRARRRCAYGCVHAAPRRRAPSRSNATKSAGVVSASIFTRDAAGWMRWLQQLEVEPGLPRRPRGGSTTISPSTTQRGGSCAVRLLDDLGEVPGQGLAAPAGQLDLVAVAEDDAPEAVPLRLVASCRRPAGISGTLLASIGSTGGMTGRSTPPSLPPGRDRARPKLTIIPANVKIATISWKSSASGSSGGSRFV